MTGGRVAAVIVNYESGLMLGLCAESLLAEGITDVVVVDNGSSDGSVDLLRAATTNVVVLDPGSNLGYGAAANRGVAASQSEFVLICNPDLSVLPGAVAALVAALDADRTAGMAGPLIRNPNGDRYPSARQFPSLVDAAGHALLGMFRPNNPFTRAYQRAELDDSDLTVRPVDWVSGACFLARRSVFEQLGGFDEAYFMYAEDVDLCWRAGRVGWQVLYVPTAEVTHHQGVSTARHPYRMIVEHHRSLLRFAGRSTQGWRRALLPVVIGGLVVRAMLACGRAFAGSRTQRGSVLTEKVQNTL